MDKAKEKLYESILSETERTGVTAIQACRNCGLDNAHAFYAWRGRRKERTVGTGLVILRSDSKGAISDAGLSGEMTVELGNAKIFLKYSCGSELADILEVMKHV